MNLKVNKLLVTATVLLLTSTCFAAKPIRLKRRVRVNQKLPIFKGGLKKTVITPKFRGRLSFLPTINKKQLVSKNRLGKTIDLKKTYTLTPSRPVDGPAHVDYANPSYVCTGPNAVAGFKSQEHLIPSSDNKLLNIYFKPLLKGRYLVELSLSGGQKYRISGCGGQEATFTGNSKPVIVFDGTNGQKMQLMVFGTTKNDYERWSFHGCRISLIR